MRIMQVIHGYPPRYNAGSEVYTQALTRGLATRHQVQVFTRQEDPFLTQYSVVDESDSLDRRIALRVVNNADSRDRYSHEAIDRELMRVFDQFLPDVVHFNHVSHLSTTMIREVWKRGVPIVYTLHDFWLMCPRGQFIKRTSEVADDPYPVCSGQVDRVCAESCYSLYFTGEVERREADVKQWSDWVRARMESTRLVASMVDRFIAPSKHLLNRFRDEFGLPGEKLTYLDYGFDRSRLGPRDRSTEKRFVFGYIGTHTPAKGIHHLLRAFAAVRGEPVLRVWGRPRDPYTASLKRLAAELPNEAGRRVEWLGEYQNERILQEVFNRVDAIVVPSIWAENSPLVIHEAQQARVAVVTADVGGMAEYVCHERNGLLFSHRHWAKMAEQMQRLIDEPALAARLGSRGYLYTDSGDVPSIEEHVSAVEEIYRALVRKEQLASGAPQEGPWRITFDTNPDDCNLQCVMCEEHSPHSSLQNLRRANGTPRRRMDIALIRQVLETCRGSRLREVIPSTMGEPLLYKHFDEFIDLCEEFSVRMNLTTNGTFPGRGARAWAQRLVPICSDVKISINGATAATQEAIMLGAKFDAVIQSVQDFVQVRDQHVANGGNRCSVTFQTTFLASNVSELPELVRIAARLGADRVKGHHLWAHFSQIRGLSMRRSAESVTRWNAIVDEVESAASTTLRTDGSQIKLENFHRLDPNRADDIAPGGRCPFLDEEAWVSAEGRFNPCCAPDAERRSLGDFGFVTGRPLPEIWKSADYRALVESYQDHELCKGCTMRRPGSSK